MLETCPNCGRDLLEEGGGTVDVFVLTLERFRGDLGDGKLNVYDYNAKPIERSVSVVSCHGCGHTFFAEEDYVNETPLLDMPNVSVEWYK